MSVKFKENTQWYKFFHVATALATAVYYKKDMHSSIGIISCEKLCLELLSQAHSFPLSKGIFPTTAVTFYNIEQQLHSLPRDPISLPPPPRYFCRLLNA